jgi:uncharacterized membrane protein YccC
MNKQETLTNYMRNPTTIYILEFLSASTLAYLLLLLYPQHRLLWAMTSIALVLSPKSAESKSLLVDRIKANILGGLIGFSIMIVHEPTIVLFCLGAVLTILLSRQLKIYRTVRTALVPLVIIMIPAYREARTIVALERMSCVIIGCVIAFLVTILFDYILSRISLPDQGGFAGRKPETDEA